MFFVLLYPRHTMLRISIHRNFYLCPKKYRYLKSIR